MKDKILLALLRKPKIAINVLAEAVGINPISVRHHLTNLQIEGLVMTNDMWLGPVIPSMKEIAEIGRASCRERV